MARRRADAESAIPVTIPMVALVMLVPLYVFIPGFVRERAVHVSAIALDSALPLQPAWALILPQNLPLENEADIYWSFPEDGSIVLVAQDGEAMKRFKITPGSETSVETALAKAK